MLQTSPLDWERAYHEVNYPIARSDDLMWANHTTNEWTALPQRRAVLYNPKSGAVYCDNASIQYIPAPYTDLWDQLWCVCKHAGLPDKPEIHIHEATNTFKTPGSSIRGDLIYWDERVKAQPHVDDYIALRLSFFASYDLSWSVKINFSGLRLWCTNGCFHDDFAVRAVERHTKAIDLRKYENVITNARERFSESGAMYQEMARTPVRFVPAMQVLSKLALVSRKPKKPHHIYQHHSVREIDLLEGYLNKYLSEEGGTKWAGYNADTHWSSHFGIYAKNFAKGQFVKQQTNSEQRVAKLFRSKEWAEL